MKHNFLENYYSYSSAKNIFWYSHKIKRKNREILHKHRALVLWFTGLSGSGKSTLASLLEEKLHKKLISTYLLDGDNIRHGLCRDLSFNRNDRRENMRRVGEVIKLLLDAGLVVIAAFVSPCNFERKMVRNMVIKNRFIEIFVDTPLEVCEKRDSKGLYKKARSGEIKNFIGVDITYEKPKNPEIYLDGKKLVKKLVNYLMFKVYKKIIFKC